MSNPRTAPLLLAQGDPAPQYWNDETGQYEATQGQYGAYLARNVGMTCVNSVDGNTPTTLALTKVANGFSIINDGDSDVSFTINELEIVVKPGESFSSLFEPFTSVAINASDYYRAVVYV